MNSSFFRLDSSDLAKGVALAVITAVLGALQQALTAHGLDVGAYDWALIGQTAGAAFIAYLGKNFFSTEDGKVLGFIG
jgi:hypothetical protein